VRCTGALLALAVAAVHVADQGGITALGSPGWIGWGFRLIEAGGVLAAVTLLLPWSDWLGWAAGLLLGVGPFTGYILTFTVGHANFVRMLAHEPGGPSHLAPAPPPSP
jgi:hypothetical protein